MKRFLTLFFSAAFATAFAAPPRLTARVEPDSIGIGDRFDLVFEIERDLVQVVDFPDFQPDPKSGFELYEAHPVDTLAREGRALKLRRRFTFAAFEEGTFDLGPAQAMYFDKNIVDTLYSDRELSLYVGTFEIDTTARTIYDIKPQRTLPFRFGEISGYLLWGLAGLVALAGLFFLLRWLLPRWGVRNPFRPAPPLPPHVVAIRDLEALHHQKLWQGGRHKAYYSALTDILRTYLAGRYGFGAREMTSDEIIHALRTHDLPQKSTMELTTILGDADLVKFAKAEPEGEQNEANYRRAYYFIEETKPVEITEEHEED